MGIITLSPFDLAMAATLVVFLAGLSVQMRLGVSKVLLIAALRTTVQLLLIGLVL